MTQTGPKLIDGKTLTLLLTEDEFLTIQHVLHDWGLIDSYFIADWKAVEVLKERFNTDRFDKEDINA